MVTFCRTRVTVSHDPSSTPRDKRLFQASAPGGASDAINQRRNRVFGCWGSRTRDLVNDTWSCEYPVAFATPCSNTY